MTSIPRCLSGACVGRSIQRQYRYKASSFASISAGIPKANRSPRYWWLVMRPEDIEVCLKPPARDVDVVIAADLMTFTKVWLGYVGFANAVESGKVSLHGSGRAMATARRLLALPDQPTLKTFRFQRSRLLARLPHNVPARATAPT